MIYMSIYIYMSTFIYVYIFFSSSWWCGGGRGWGTRERACTSGPCGLVTHVLYPTHGPLGMSAEHVPTPALTVLTSGCAQPAHKSCGCKKKSGDKHIYIYIYIYWGVYACITNGKHACTSADFFRIYQTPANLGPSNASNASNELEYCPFPL